MSETVQVEETNEVPEVEDQLLDVIVIVNTVQKTDEGFPYASSRVMRYEIEGKSLELIIQAIEQNALGGGIMTEKDAQ